ncbi:hypothetical protein PYW08_012274 [Mythimna loreyi]|uniref:Uncharacterized protein n=1 Tax=Mythimna loreyi TaxID=667449 RepID=A0ACC2PZQ8_9NEOP|nr:hypothetical protein PYW08_012274 [Mythimna loreyi]
MDPVFKDTVHLSEGINLRELMSSNTAEFSIDLDFKKRRPVMFDCDAADFMSDLEEDNDSEDSDTLKGIEQSAEKMLLSSPEYHSFEQLATKMVDCHPSGDVKILIIEEGDGPLVPPDAEVTIHHAGYYERADVPFDSTLHMNRGQPLTIRMGVGKMLPGLELGLSCVKGPTARFHLLLQPAAAYGPLGVLPRIQPKPVLFVICLYKVRTVEAASCSFNDLPMVEQAKFENTLKTVKSIRSEAKVLFSREKFYDAIRSYQQALSVLSLSRPENDEEEAEIKDLKVNIYVNLTVCYYKINKPKYIIGMCQQINRYIDINTHCKAMFYYGKAYELLGNIDEAISCYKKALKVEPKNKEIGKILANLDQKSKKSAVDEKVMWRKALSNAPEVEEKKVFYDVDDSFKNGVIDMCQDLAGRSDFAKFDLPTGLSPDEILCIKELTSKFKCLEYSFIIDHSLLRSQSCQINKETAIDRSISIIDNLTDGLCVCASDGAPIFALIFSKFPLPLTHICLNSFPRNHQKYIVTMEPKPHDMVTCPYNMSHQVEHYRMHIHLQKCRRQYPNSGKTNCPFDSTHVVNEVEMDYHVTTCPKRDMLDTKLYVMDDDQRPAVPVVHSATSDTVLDDWGNEPHVTTYKPDYSKKGAHIIQKIKGATPSERRKARMEGIKNYKPPE